MTIRTRVVVSILALAAHASCNGPPPPAATSDAAAPPARTTTDYDAAAAETKTTPATRLVLHAERALVPRTGEVIAPAWVVIDHQRLESIARSAPPNASDALDLGDATILPGLIDAHTHLLHAETTEEGSMVAEVVTMSDADRALRGARYARQMLEAGFTTVRDLGNAGHGADIALKRAVAQGWVEGPTLLVSTRALAAPGGQFPRLAGMSHEEVIEHEYATVKSPDDARAAVRQAFYEGADCIKLIVDNDGAGRTLTSDEVRAAVEIAHASGKKVAAHVLTEKAAALAVAAGVDSLEHGYEMSDATLAETAKRKIFLVPTDYPLAYYERFAPQGPRHQASLEHMAAFHQRLVDRLRRAKKLGVPIAAGSDAYTVAGGHDRGRDATLIFRAYAEAGLTPTEVVQTATTNAASVLGLPEHSGSLEVGAPADLLVVRGDASQDASALERPIVVVKGGRIVHKAP